MGIVNDFDLATWVNHSTTNNNCTGTIPFMAIDLLDGGIDGCTPQLYQHNIESFVWLLAYITVAEVVYKDHTLRVFVEAVGKSLGEGDTQKRFEKVKTLLLRVIDSMSVAVQIV